MSADANTTLALLRRAAREGGSLFGVSDWSQAEVLYTDWRNRVDAAILGIGQKSLSEDWRRVSLFGFAAEGATPTKAEWALYRVRVEIGINWITAWLEVYGGNGFPEKWLERRRRIFIGHGRSPQWRELKDFLQDRLGLDWEEFNRDSSAGLATVERLSAMLNSAGFAFLVMTAEDMHVDGKAHARENVIHEIGLFQGRLGFRQAIILLEEGCEQFSNIHGLTQIRFPKGDILARSEEIRRVLQREDILRDGQ